MQICICQMCICICICQMRICQMCMCICICVNVHLYLYLSNVYLSNVYVYLYLSNVYLSNFDSTPLTCDPNVFPGKVTLNIAKNNRIFPGKGRWIKDFFLTYLDSSMAEVFPHCHLFFSILTIFKRESQRGFKVGPKLLTLGLSLFHKYSILDNTTANSILM